MAGLITDDAATPGGPRAKERERALTSAVNSAGMLNETEPVRFYVYIHTVSPIPFDKANGNAIEHALIPLVELPAADPLHGKRYATWKVKLRHRFPQPVGDVFSTGRDPFDYHDARRIAQDICDPTNPSLDQSIENFRGFNFQEGTASADFGVFWSENETPTEEELLRAEKRRDKTFARLRQRADEMIGQRGNAALSQLTIYHRMAFEFVNEIREWNKRPVPMKECPNCATMIPQSAGFHFMNGICCVNDWKRAVDSGVKSRDDVPREARWWQGPGRPAGKTEEDAA